MKLRYWIAIVIGAILVISAFVYVLTPVDDVEQEGIPVTTIRLDILKVDENNNIIDKASAEWEMKSNDDVPTPVLKKTHTLTSVRAASIKTKCLKIFSIILLKKNKRRR